METEVTFSGTKDDQNAYLTVLCTPKSNIDAIIKMLKEARHFVHTDIGGYIQKDDATITKVLENKILITIRYRSTHSFDHGFCALERDRDNIVEQVNALLRAFPE